MATQAEATPQERQKVLEDAEYVSRSSGSKKAIKTRLLGVAVSDSSVVELRSNKPGMQTLTDADVDRLQEFLEAPMGALGQNVSEIKSSKNFRETFPQPARRDSEVSGLRVAREQVSAKLRLGPEAPLSAFGDGDGSFWDRWCSAPSLLLDTVPSITPAMPVTSSHANGFIAPRSGFKRMRQEQLGSRNVILSSRQVQRLDSIRFPEFRAVGDKEKAGKEASDRDPRSPIRDRFNVDKLLTSDAARAMMGTSALPGFINTYRQVGNRRCHFTKEELKHFEEDHIASTSKEKKTARLALHEYHSMSAVQLRRLASQNTMNKRSMTHSRSALKLTSMASRGSQGSPTASSSGSIHGQLDILGAHIDEDMTEEELDDPFESSLDAADSEARKMLHMTSDQLIVAHLGQKEARERFIYRIVADELLPESRVILRQITGRLTDASHPSLPGGWPPGGEDTYRQVMALDLRHRGLGDMLGKALARCLPDMPLLKSLNLRNNRFTDESLLPIIQGLSAKEDLFEVDMSQNKFDKDGSTALRQWLCRPSCPVRDLGLSNADVDDDELAIFLDELRTNFHLRSLDLSMNKIGQTELMNVVRPETVTGAEALATWLTNDCRLRKLNLSWNFIRLASAVAFGQALESNTSLQELDLSHNAFGRAGGEAVARSLHINQTLCRLNMASNAIGARPAFVFAAAAKANDTLEVLNLSENPVGKVGTKALTLLSGLGYPLHVVMNNCNVEAEDKDCWFDVNDPRGNYRGDMPTQNSAEEKCRALDLADPYDHAVACELTRLFAMNEALKLEQMTVTDEAGNVKDVALEVFVKEADTADDIAPALLMQAEDLFQQHDTDNSGEIDRQELLKVLHSLGLSEKNRDLEHIMSLYDVDGSDTIERGEFVELMQHLRHELKQKRRRQVYAVEKGSKRRWKPPYNGLLEVTCIFDESNEGVVMTASSLDVLLKNLDLSVNSSEALSIALSNFKLHAGEAQRIITHIKDNQGDIVQALAQVVQYSSEPSHVRLLIQHNLRSEEERRRLKRRLDPSYGALLGVPNGHYVLNLTDPRHRTCLQRLLDVSNVSAAGRRRCHLLDCSQVGNQTCFRNAKYNGIEVKIDMDFVRPPIETGTLSFDFVLCKRPLRGAHVLSTAKFVDVLYKCDLVDGRDALESVADAMKSRSYDGQRYELTQEFWKAFHKVRGMSIDKNYWKSREMITRELDLREMTKKSSVINAAVTISPEDVLEPSDRKSSAYPKKAKLPAKRSMALRRQLSGFIQRAAIRRRAAKQIEVARFQNVLETLVFTLGTRWISMTQLLYFIELFADKLDKCDARTGEAGYLPLVELVHLLHSRVLDLYNFPGILKLLTPNEAAHLVHRLGWLAVWSPIQPDGYFELWLRHREERLIAKAYIMLKLAEGYNCLVGETFRWKSDEPDIPGWSLNRNWFLEDGVPHRGVFRFEYRSKITEGADVNHVVRTGLCALCMAEPPMRRFTASLEDAVTFPTEGITRAARKKLGIATSKQASAGALLGIQDEWVAPYRRFDPTKLVDKKGESIEGRYLLHIINQTMLELDIEYDMSAESK